MSEQGNNKAVHMAGNADLRHSEIELDRAIESLKSVAQSTRTPALGPAHAPPPASAGAIMNIPVEVHAVFGAARMSFAELSDLGPGSTVILDRHAGDPVDIIANGVRIAVGEMVVLDEESGRFGFRLVDIVK